MEILLCTIGFAGKTAEEFFRLLQEAQVEKLIDIRLNRGGQLSGFAKHPDLEYFLQKVARIGYSHEPQLAPTSELLDTYRESKDWPAYETGFLALMRGRGVPQASIKDENHWKRLVDECFRREAGPQTAVPDPAQDLIETGVLDSMGWVSFLRALESASGLSELGALLTERTPSFESVFQVFKEAQTERLSPEHCFSYATQPAARTSVYISSSCAVVGSRKIPSEEVDRAFGMPPGKLRLRAGIESLAYAAEDENELTLGARAAQQALHSAACGAQELDWIHRGHHLRRS